MPPSVFPHYLGTSHDGKFFQARELPYDQTALLFGEEDPQERRCLNLDCGRVFKDLQAHILTHQPERSERCPILNCEYNPRGFTQIDKNRHTLAHYKGAMVCGFCPGSSSAAEKSFNRADVKRRLTSVHGVEQSAPNSRKRSPTASTGRPTGKCSTCSATFTDAQEFYEHLDDCVLRVVQQEKSSEAHNQRHLATVANDDDVRENMEWHMLGTVDEIAMTVNEDLEEEEDDDDEDEDDLPGQVECTLNQGSWRNQPGQPWFASYEPMQNFAGIHRKSDPVREQQERNSPGFADFPALTPIHSLSTILSDRSPGFFGGIQEHSSVGNTGSSYELVQRRGISETFLTPSTSGDSENDGAPGFLTNDVSGIRGGSEEHLLLLQGINDYSRLKSDFSRVL
jgi:hypothetical protein